MEVWKVVSEYPKYEVSNMGRVRNIATGRILKPIDDRRGYLRIRVHKNKQGVSFKIHRIVAEAFCRDSKTQRRKYVNHKNLDKHDNRAENLEWVTARQNSQHWRKMRDLMQAQALAADIASGDALPY